MRVRCRSCGRDIPAEDVNIDSAIAKCSACDAVFSFMDQIEPEARERARGRRPDVPMPESFRIERGMRELVITRRWFNLGVVVLALFCVFWDGFLVVWYSLALGQGAAEDSAGPPLMALLFPLLHVAVGLGLTYWVVAGFVNRTEIRAGEGQLAVRHGPMPWPGNLTVSSHDVAQLYCKRKVRHTKNGTRQTFRVEMLCAGGGKKALVTGLDDGDEALFIEQALEDYLEIEDRAVPGELARA